MTTSSTLRNAKLYGNEIIQTPIGDIELVHTYFNDEASQHLFDEMDYQRACQTYIWSQPLVSMTNWRDRQKADYNATNPFDFVVFKSLKEKRGILTANLTTPYIFNFTSLKAGPLVVDYPAGETAGGFMDFWQRPLADVGLTGPDQGQGATYIIVGPEDDLQKYDKNEQNVYVIQSATNNLFLGLRILNSGTEFYERFKSSLKMGQDRESLQNVNFIEDLDVEWNATAPRGIKYWQVLSSIINEEPVRVIDKAWMAMLLPLGIEKDKDFHPNERQTSILEKGGAMGELMARNLQVNPRFAEPYWQGTQWYKSVDFTIPQETENRVELDERTTWFYEAVATSKGMVNPTPGKGQIYMTTKRDSQGNPFRADKTYKLTVPNDVPVPPEQFWSLSLYSENTRRSYDNGGTEISSVSLDSRMENLQYNDDKSIDLFIGAEAPAGYESNFMKTVGEDGWFVYFRLYAPLDPFFDKTFSLPDFVEID
ncbi:hypothetical protein PA905_01560 [Planktothrix agardhii CCAP 1459/11A]|uniref:DUF1254 domain-containing protein n=1 Tax=Planktothrix agardhii CCAP 1459/11A TaxID=282420 RepID=A0A4P5ZSE4_PLAAG|nr:MULTISPECIES: DUF1214 domain-containing protein [Planktothrix]GDZ92461.1 hypothetical protein PA905_01560 [Planktothrix agardhii CCAP 1459/11A]